MKVEILGYDGAIDLLKIQDDINPQKMAFIGFSRGGFLSLHYVLDNPTAVAAVVLMSPSTGGAGEITFQDALGKLDQLAIPLMVLPGP
jgi:predicted esterase